jgi:hypothetical protein
MSNDNKKVGVEGSKRDSNGVAGKDQTLWPRARSLLTGKDEQQNGKKSGTESGDTCVDSGHTYCPPPLAPTSSSSM